MLRLLAAAVAASALAVSFVPLPPGGPALADGHGPGEGGPMPWEDAPASGSGGAEEGAGGLPDAVEAAEAAEALEEALDAIVKETPSLEPQEAVERAPEPAGEDMPAEPQEAVERAPEPAGEDMPAEPQGAAGESPGPAGEDMPTEPQGAAGESPEPAGEDMPAEPQGAAGEAAGSAEEDMPAEPQGAAGESPEPAGEDMPAEPQGAAGEAAGPAGGDMPTEPQGAMEKAPEPAGGDMPTEPQGAMEKAPEPAGGDMPAGPQGAAGEAAGPAGGDMPAGPQEAAESEDVPVGMVPAGGLPVEDLGPPPSAEGAVVDLLAGGIEALAAEGAERMAESARAGSRTVPAPVLGPVPVSPLEGVAPSASVAPEDLRASDFGDARAALGRAVQDARGLLAEELAGVSPPAVMDRGAGAPSVGWLEEAGREVQLMQSYGQLFGMLESIHASSAELRRAAVDARIEGIGRAVSLLQAVDAGQAALSGLGEGDLASVAPETLQGTGAPGLGVAVLRAGPRPVVVSRIEALTGGVPGTGELQVARDGCTGRPLGAGSSCDVAYSWGGFPGPGSLVFEVSDLSGRGSQIIAVPFQGVEAADRFPPGLEGIVAGLSGAAPLPGEGPLVGLAPDREPPEFRAVPADAPVGGPAGSPPSDEPPPEWVAPPSGILLVSMVQEVGGGAGPEVWLRRYADDGSWSDFRGQPGAGLPWGGTLLSADVGRQSAFVERADGQTVEVRAWWPGSAGR